MERGESTGFDILNVVDGGGEEKESGLWWYQPEMII